MPVYAVLADLTADDRVPDGLAAATGNRLLANAEDLVDRLVPNRRAYASTGRLFDVGATGGLSAVQIAALRDVTVALAAEEYLDPGAFAPAAGESVSGPDFSVSGIRNGSPAGAAALRRAAGTLDRLGLRRLTARAMP